VKHLGFAVVGVSYRDAPSSVRAALLKADAGKRSPSAELLEAGKARGVVRVETCSRVEWLIEADEPAWAAELLRGALSARAAEAQRLHARVGASAVHHLLRVAAGLDSIAQGEHAVGRQVLKAFERAHAAGTTGRALKACWRVTGQMLHALRDVLPQRQTIGVQSLAARTLLAQGVAPGAKVLVFGQGDIGRATTRALERAHLDGKRVFRRADLPRFLEEAAAADAVVVCSGAPEAWLALPRRDDLPVVVDVGSPAQVLKAEGWKSFSLDHLLDEGATLLPDELSGAVAQECEHAAHELIRLLEAPSKGRELAAIDAARRLFLRDTLPPLLEGLTPAQQRAVVSRVSEFTHQMLREVSGPTP
jgi:glutamyl-tRNA reductase